MYFHPDDNVIRFGTLTPEGRTETATLKQSDVLACPHAIMWPTHYRDDGSCKCDDPQEQAKMCAEWGYSPEDFA